MVLLILNIFFINFFNENHFQLATLGMVRNCAGVLVPQANAMESKIRKIVTMHDEDYSRVSHPSILALRCDAR